MTTSSNNNPTNSEGEALKSPRSFLQQFLWDAAIKILVGVAVAAVLAIPFKESIIYIADKFGPKPPIEMGVVAADNTNSDWKLSSGATPRTTWSKHVSFRSRLKNPKVSVAIMYFHASSGRDVNLGVSAEEVTEDGFTLVISTGVGAVINGAAASWVACPQ